MRKLLVIISVFFCVSAYAQTGSNYVTPDNWRIHYNPNGAKASMNGISAGGATIKLGATVRSDMRFASSSDSNFYAYLNGRISGVELGSGDVNINFNMRGATDFSGKINSPRYRFLYNSLDSSRGDNTWDFRLYQANVEFNNVIQYTKLTAGRMYLDHLSYMHLDGGDLVIGTDEYNGFIYYGAPVSLYKSSLNSQVLGGGLDTNPADFVRLRGEVVKFYDDSEYDADTFYWTLRGDVDYTFSIIEGGVYAQVGMMEDAVMYNYGTYGTIVPTGTTYDVWIKGQYDRVDKEINSYISDFDLVTGEQSQFIQFGARVNHGFTRHFAAGLGFETRHNYDDYYGDRDYFRYMADVDFIDLIPNNYISITADYWYVPGDGDYKENRKLYLGGRVSQIINENVEVWAGAALTNYRYYFKQYDRLPTLADYSNKKLNKELYLLYIGVSVVPVENLLVQIDYTYEQSQVINSFDSSNDSISTIAFLAGYTW